MLRACETALRRFERSAQADLAIVARDVNTLDWVLRALGDLAGAKAAYERALRTLERTLPSEHSHIRSVR